MPREEGRPAAALGGAQLAINARSRQADQAWALVQYLTAPEQMLERAEGTGQFPSRRSLYDDPRLADALPIPPDIAQAHRRACAAAADDAGLQSALGHPADSAAPCADAAGLSRGRPARRGRQHAPRPRHRRAHQGELVKIGPSTPGRDRRLAWTLLLPALLLLGAVAVGPLLATVWESLHHHDLRMPWLGRPFVGLDNYRVRADRSAVAGGRRAHRRPSPL